MKLLHLYANYKWTGPADLALVLAAEQDALARERGAGDEVELAVASWMHRGVAAHPVRERAAELGVRTREGLRLRRHLHVGAYARDAGLLARWIDDREVDLVVCHQDGDHFVAALGVSLAARRASIVRHGWGEAMPRWSPRSTYAFARTSALLVPFPEIAAELRARGSPVAARVRVAPPPLAAEFFSGDEDPAEGRAALRAELGLGDEVRLVGLTARIQSRRRWDLLWDTLVAIEDPRVHLAVLGRPDQGVFEQVCARPLAARGLTARVHFLGYRRGDAYRSALHGLDLFLFLVPGSDATCRALREAMALGLPVVTTDLGLLPAIVGDSGLVRAPRAADLAAAVRGLVLDPDRRWALSRLARGRARGWHPRRAAEASLAAYSGFVG